MRVVLTNQDLTGQVLDASTRPDGHARESLVRGCTFDLGTRFVGDIRGTDFIGNTGPADWRAAQTYSCYWRGNQNLSGSLWPADIGSLHHEPVGTIIRDRVALVAATARPKVIAVASYVLGGDYARASWDTSKTYWWDGLTVTQREKLAAAFRLVFQPYPGLAERFEELVKALKEGTPLFQGAPLATDVSWPDGASIHLDAMNLPALPEPSRYALARWLEAQADLQQPAPHHCFVYSALPPIVRPLPQPDDWFSPGWHWRGY